MERTFSFVDTGAHDGNWNMHFDVSRAEQLDRGEAEPMLRVYRWDPWCISLGRHQSADDIDLDAARRAGYDVVTRPTGGRAILHAEELTYCVVMPSEGRSIMDVYRSISEALTEGLRLLVPDIGVAKAQPNFQKLYREAGSIPCFSSSARYEIEFGGRKVVGSAQRRIGSTVLQHGSILIDRAHLALPDYLNVGDDVRAQLRHDMEEHTVTLRDIMGSTPEYDQVRDALREGFEKAWGVNFSFSPPNEYISGPYIREADER